MGLFGPTQSEIRNAIQDAIGEKTQLQTKYILYPLIDGKPIVSYPGFEMSDTAFNKKEFRQLMYKNIKDWAREKFSPEVKINYLENKVEMGKPHIFNGILITSKTNSQTYYPLKYKTKFTEGPNLSVGRVDPESFEEEWFGFERPTE